MPSRIAQSHATLIISIALVLSGILFRDELKLLYENFLRGPSDLEQEGIFTEAKIALYDGIKQNKIYLAVLGTVFDVTKGRKHYKKGAGYHYFVGKDGSRALVTGNFEDESNNKDHVLDLTCSQLFSLIHWKNTFTSKYEAVGILIGRYYDKTGQPTSYSIEFEDKIEQCLVEKEMSEKEHLKYPPCNSAWNAEEGTKVWCTKSSGGVVRSWVGVPRLLYTPGIERPRCACVNIQNQEHISSLLKEYDNCPNTSDTCVLNA